MKKNVLIIAHRCGPDVYPEQTIISARHALSQGADVIEVDVQFTLDQVPVICHDANTKRIFGFDSQVSEMTSDHFLQLRHVTDRAYPSHLMDDMLEVGIAPVLFHCKFSGPLLTNVLDHVTTFNYENKVIIGVLQVEDITIIKSHNPAIKTLGFIQGINQIDQFLEARTDIIRLWQPWVHQDLIDHIHAFGRQVWIMAGDPSQGGVGYTSESHLRTWADMGVDGILINEVMWARKVLGYVSKR